MKIWTLVAGGIRVMWCNVTWSEVKWGESNVYRHNCVNDAMIVLCIRNRGIVAFLLWTPPRLTHHSSGSLGRSRESRMQEWSEVLTLCRVSNWWKSWESLVWGIWLGIVFLVARVRHSYMGACVSICKSHQCDCEVFFSWQCSCLVKYSIIVMVIVLCMFLQIS